MLKDNNRKYKKSKRILTATLGLVAGGSAVLGTQTLNASANAMDTQNNNDTYIVKPGDTLSKISKDHNVNLNSLVDFNHLSSPKLIYAGSVLKLAPTYHADIYKVKAGDTLTSIANKYQMNIDDLKKMNNLNTDFLSIDQSLKVKNKSKDNHDSNQITSNNLNNATNQNSNVNTTNQSSSSANTTNNNNVQYNNPNSSNNSDTDQAWIANHESSNNYEATNGRYYGKYQLDISYLHGDLSPQNQERVANSYVQNRYGSWTKAREFWEAHHWY